MIKNGEFKNIFGIKNFKIDFELKHAGDKEQIDQISNIGGETITLIPTILAKNAAGKTSLIKAIQFALRFASEKEFGQNIFHYVMNIVSDYFRKSGIKSFKQQDTDEIFVFKSPEKIIKEIFEQISFAGSELTEIELELTKKRKLKLEISESDFFVVLNNETLNIKNILSEILNEIETVDTKRTLHGYMELINSKIDNIVGNIEFYSEQPLSVSIFRDTTPITRLREIRIKDITNKHINKLSNELGSEALILIIKKLDRNIKNIKFDSESKTFDIYISNSDNPIAPKVLSFGTQKVLEILSRSIPLFKNGGVMLIDEIENGLHLSLIKLITSIFENKDINKKQAQLLMTTHNPLIGERGIVRQNNLFMYENLSFINVKQIKLDSNKRTYDQVKVIKSKNYYNDLFWEINDLDVKSTISDIAINQIIDAMQGGLKWLKR